MYGLDTYSALANVHVSSPLQHHNRSRNPTPVIVNAHASGPLTPLNLLRKPNSLHPLLALSRVGFPLRTHSHTSLICTRASRITHRDLKGALRPRPVCLDTHRHPRTYDE
jgi:hypothetical protein